VAVKVNERELVHMSREGGHRQTDDTIWAIKVPGAEVGDHYKYLITSNGVTREFIDPRAQQLTSAKVGGASVIVDPSVTFSQSVEPSFSQMVLYELHIGTFNVLLGQTTGTFESAIEKLDYLNKLGVNVV
jgi:1,4-alpha-glucan branching enzyme